MAKRTADSVRRTAAALGTPARRRASGERTLTAATDAAPVAGTLENQLREPIGATGTLNLWGFITGEDYNPALDGYPMFPVYDQMRRSDAQVNATLLQIKLPIKAARRVIKPASDDPQDRAIADFVHEALLTEGAFARPFSQVLDNALLRFDFGCSGEEIVWTIGPSGETRFADLAPRLPRTFYRWLEDSKTNALAILQQYAPKNGAYGFFDIPAARLVRHANQQEGNNYYGRAIIRAAYPNYFWKQQLYRIDAVRLDRFGIGIPVAKLTENYSQKTAPLDKLEATLQGLRSHDRAYLIQPWGVEFDILVPKGGEAGANGLMNSVEHHNVMIARNILQQFQAQGEQRHGSFGAARVTFDAFYDALEGACREIGTEFDHGAIRPLCDANFDMRNRAYPQFSFADLASADTESISSNLSALTNAGLITPDDTLENWLREIHDAPALPEALLGQRAVGVAPLLPAGPAMRGRAKTGAPTVAKPGKATIAAAALERWTELGRTFGREPTALERQIFELHQFPAALDTQQALLTRALADIRGAQLGQLAVTIAKKDARETAAFTDLRHAHVRMPGASKLRAAIRAAQDRAVVLGQEAVRQELEKQGVSLPIELDDESPVSTRTTLRSALVTSAQNTAKRLHDLWHSQILDVATRARRSGARGDALTAAIVTGLQEAVESGVKRDAAGEVNEAVGLGRAAEAQRLKTYIGRAIYSCVLDVNSCEVCVALDKEEFEIDSAEYLANMPPNQFCDGTKSGQDLCRCVYLYLSTTAVQPSGGSV